MKKWYFISFDFWCDKGAFNKFHSSVLEVDFKETNLTKVVNSLIKEHHSDLDISTVTVKINAFNLV